MFKRQFIEALKEADPYDVPTFQKLINHARARTNVHALACLLEEDFRLVSGWANGYANPPIPAVRKMIYDRMLEAFDD